jgi:hypothetical protein
VKQSAICDNAWSLSNGRAAAANARVCSGESAWTGNDTGNVRLAVKRYASLQARFLSAASTLSSMPLCSPPHGRALSPIWLTRAANQAVLSAHCLNRRFWLLSLNCPSFDLIVFFFARLPQRPRRPCAPARLPLTDFSRPGTPPGQLSTVFSLAQQSRPVPTGAENPPPVVVRRLATFRPGMYDQPTAALPLWSRLRRRSPALRRLSTLPSNAPGPRAQKRGPKWFGVENTSQHTESWVPPSSTLQRTRKIAAAVSGRRRWGY